MLIIKKICLHLFIILIVCIVFTLLFYFGNAILLCTISIKPEDRWEYSNTFFDIFITSAVGFCLPGYLTFLVVQFIIKKNGLNFRSHLLGSVSFLLFAFIFVFLLGFGFMFSNPYTIKNLIVIALSGYIAAILQKALFKKFTTQKI